MTACLLLADWMQDLAISTSSYTEVASVFQALIQQGQENEHFPHGSVYSVYSDVKMACEAEVTKMHAYATVYRTIASNM